MANWVAAEIVDDVERADAARVARRLGGIIANNERIRAAIQAAMDDSTNASDDARCHRVLGIVAAELTASQRAGANGCSTAKEAWRAAMRLTTAPFFVPTSGALLARISKRRMELAPHWEAVTMSAIFVAEFQNEFIECETAEDASALMTADTLLVSNSANDCTPLELERLVATLKRYDLPNSAARLDRISALMRAAVG
jgi:hypothetical protein